MQNTLVNLRGNANALNNQFYSGVSSACLANEIESQLREILSYSSIPGYMVDDLEGTISILEKNITSSNLNFLEKERIRPLLYKAKKKTEIRLKNPNHIKISNYTTEKLLSLKYHGYTGDIVLSSGMRSIEDQARIMYENIVRTGTQYQKDEVYDNNGDKVIDVFDPKLSREENISNMKKMIEKIKESDKEAFKHTGDFSKLNTIDVDENTLSNVQNFMDAAKSAGFFQILRENHCVHIVLPQPQ